jgi:mRNA guanylyltransferase
MAGSAPVNLSDVADHIQPADEDMQRRAVADLLKRNHLSFPGAQPVSFARAHLKELQTTDYFMCEKTDGVRCLMYLTQVPREDGGVLEVQFLIDRKNDYYFVPRESIHLPVPGNFERHHVGTLLDGELVRETYPNGTSRLAYLIFDLLAIDGDSVTSRPFDKRLARIEQFIMKPFREFARDNAEWVKGQPFQIQMKQMDRPYGMEIMFKERIPNLTHGNDGLIFTCRETP